ncbi:MAG: glycerophosphodiester phosphodiesterase family protein [Oscillospiraceae bacterium]|nr:glycerophosphodiester phosphodiesterase family protein [Oscillospiraceae bacterium]
MCLRACRSGAIDWSRFRPYRYAHRGLHNLGRGISENSLPAFQAAADRGFGAELDVRLTRDGALAVIHDRNLRRLCGVDREVNALTCAELRALPLLGTGLQIPLLEEVLPLFAGKSPLIVELKADGANAAALADQVCRTLDRFSVSCCVESFDPRVLFWLRRHRGDICRGQLACDFSKRPGPVPRPLRWALTRLFGNFLSRPDFIAYRFEDRAQPAVAFCRRRYGVPEISWTIHSPQDLETAERDGCIPIFDSFIPADSKRPCCGSTAQS